MAKTKDSKVDKNVSAKPATSKESKKATTTKEAPTKAKESKLEKVTVTAKVIGRNLNVIVGNEKFTRMGTKEELEEVKASIKAYDAKPTKANLDAMMKALKPETTKKEEEKEKVKADIKSTKKKIESQPEKISGKKRTIVKDVVKDIDDKELTTEEIQELKKAIDRQETKKASAPAARTSSSGRRGEY